VVIVRDGPDAAGQISGVSSSAPLSLRGTVSVIAGDPLGDSSAIVKPSETFIAVDDGNEVPALREHEGALSSLRLSARVLCRLADEARLRRSELLLREYSGIPERRQLGDLLS
jgi:hypothetical protein